MTPEQNTAMQAAVASGDDVRIVTIALQVAASLARNKRQDDAIKIRSEVDRIHHEAAEREEYKKRREKMAGMVASGVMANRDTSADLRQHGLNSLGTAVVKFADCILKELDKA